MASMERDNRKRKHTDITAKQGTTELHHLQDPPQPGLCYIKYNYVPSAFNVNTGRVRPNYTIRNHTSACTRTKSGHESKEIVYGGKNTMLHDLWDENAHLCLFQNVCLLIDFYDQHLWVRASFCSTPHVHPF